MHQKYMQLALAQAEYAASIDEVPVGAIIVKNDTVIAQGYNHPIASNNPCMHAEIHALTLAGLKLNNYRLTDCILYTTLEPCLMCLGAMLHARIKSCLFAATEPKFGTIISNPIIDKIYTNHTIDFQQGLMAKESSKLLQEFFKNRR